MADIPGTRINKHGRFWHEDEIYLVTNALTILNHIYRVVHNKGIDKIFNSDLLITLIHSFIISLDSVDL